MGVLAWWSLLLVWLYICAQKLLEWRRIVLFPANFCLSFVPLFRVLWGVSVRLKLLWSVGVLVCMSRDLFLGSGGHEQQHGHLRGGGYICNIDISGTFMLTITSLKRSSYSASGISSAGLGSRSKTRCRLPLGRNFKCSNLHGIASVFLTWWNVCNFCVQVSELCGWG